MALGFVLSMELIGMAFGSIFLGSLADKIGRRPTVLGCLVVMATRHVHGHDVDRRSRWARHAGLCTIRLRPGRAPGRLAVWRIITGLGIGGMLAAINAVAAEFSNTKRRNLNVAIMSIGYPVGAALGGFITSAGLESRNWRSVFYFGASVTVVMIPIGLLPHARVGALARAQAARGRARQNQPDAQALRPSRRSRRCRPCRRMSASGRVEDLFRPPLLTVTILATMAYFFHITTFYYIVKWVPTLVVGMGFAPSSAGYVLSWLNVGGATGGTVLGLLSQRFSVKALTITVMLLSTIAVTAFGRSPAGSDAAALICMVAGFFTNAAITGHVRDFRQAFPTHVRASGTGFAVGVGRGGSVLAPIIGGFLLAANLPLSTVAMIMACGSLIAAGLIAFLRLRARTVGARSRGRHARGGSYGLKGAVAHGR